MLKVLLVDDEPFILQGLKVLIDWENEGFEIVSTAANGEEALMYLGRNQVDLVITDIRMPVLTGFELLEKIRKQNISDAYFVILSGYADFSYAQQAIRFKCTDYILKPVRREELMDILCKVTALNDMSEQKNQTNRQMERAYLARNFISVITGKYDNVNLEYVLNHIQLSEGIRYIEIELDEEGLREEASDEEKRDYQRKLYEVCLEFLKDDANHCVFDVSGHEKIYDIGFVYCDYMAKKEQSSEKEYLGKLSDYLRDNVQFPVIMVAGKKVPEIANLARSYGTACMLRSIQGFRRKRNIFYYEDEVQVKNVGVVLCKKSLDSLLNAVEQNDHAVINRSVEMFYQEMQQMGAIRDSRNLNINYLLFQLIHLATEQDDGVNQEEILRIISESSFEDGIMRGSKAHLSRFACEYGDYLMQLRKKVSRGVLGEIEKEIRTRYSENLTLKGLSEKYYLNSAYLGQLFRKKYDCSFKDYLNSYRMEQAAAMLLRTDRKIYEIQEAVGYHDMDYFVNRFIMAKGCTPAKYRKQARQEKE